MAKVDISQIDRDLLTVTGLWSQLLHVLGHPCTIHAPSIWMGYKCPSMAFQECSDRNPGRLRAARSVNDALRERSGQRADRDPRWRRLTKPPRGMTCLWSSRQ